MQEKNSTRWTKQTRWDGTAKPGRAQTFSCFGRWSLCFTTALRCQPHPVPVGPQSSEASLKPCEKGTSFFMYGCFDSSKASPEDRSAFSFHTNQPDLACENCLAFHNENSAPPAVCIFGLGCTRAMGSRKAVDAFCRYVDSHPNCGLWYEIQSTNSRFSFANSQQSKCTSSVLKRLSSTCMIMDGHLSSQSSTLSRKVMSHWWCHFYRWETLDFNLNLHQRKLICPVHVLACEKWFWELL